MTKEEILESIKAGCLEAMSNDGNELSKFALFSYFAASMDKEHVDSTTIDISDFKNGAYEEVYENFQNALIKFIKDYK